MENMVLYASRSGNTKQVGNAIAEALDCKAVDLKKTGVEEIKLDDIKNIFLGSGIYAEFMNPKIKKFVKSDNLKKAAEKSGKNVIFFVTWVGNPGSVQHAIEKTVKEIPENGVYIYTDHFRAYGSMLKIFKKGHPSQEELIQAKEWAREVIEII